MALTEYQLWHRALARLKATCEQDGVPFSITTDAVLKLPYPTVCEYTGLPLQRSQGQWSANAPVLVPVDISLGYVAGNVKIVSNLAATLLTTLSPDQLIVLANKLAPTPIVQLDDVLMQTIATASVKECRRITNLVDELCDDRMNNLATA